MAQQEKTYEEVVEAKEIIQNLCDMYPDELWAVRPETIITLGVSNKESPKSSKKLASICPLKGATKALMQINNVNIRYLIELYWSDYNEWNMAQKIAVIFHELIHIDSEVGKTVKHDVEDFRIMVDKLGVNWFNDKDLPNLLLTKVEFDKSMRPNVPEDGTLEVDTGDEIVKEIEEVEETEAPEETEDEEVEEDGEEV
ncbi:hypothetical protein D4R86_02175 [bacterium]|nr:MAG: hypothetical protein D4R86_02175 [bacterium]